MHWTTAQDTLLAEFLAHERIGILTDMDGTLSHFVNVPSEAYPTPRSRELLQAIHEKVTLVAVISGRAAADLRERVGLPQLVYAGNHGLERWRDDRVVVAEQAQTFMPKLAQVRDAIQAIIPPDDGAWIEYKDVTFSVHYRQSTNPEWADTTLGEEVRRIAEGAGLRVFDGLKIYEVRPPIDLNKGTIFKELVEDYALDAALFIGDDVTDTDAFRIARQLRETGQCFGLAVGVQSPTTPDVVFESSDVLVDGVEGVEDFLSWLLDALSAS